MEQDEGQVADRGPLPFDELEAEFDTAPLVALRPDDLRLEMEVLAWEVEHDRLPLGELPPRLLHPGRKLAAAEHPEPGAGQRDVLDHGGCAVDRGQHAHREPYAGAPLAGVPRCHDLSGRSDQQSEVPDEEQCRRVHPPRHRVCQRGQAGQSENGPDEGGDGQRQQSNDERRGFDPGPGISETSLRSDPEPRIGALDKLGQGRQHRRHPHHLEHHRKPRYVVSARQQDQGSLLEENRPEEHRSEDVKGGDDGEGPGGEYHDRQQHIQQ